MRLVVGLRNPGAEYEGTRHNIGGEVAVALARKNAGRLKRNSMRTRSEVAEMRLGDHRVVVAVPHSFMNHSGGPVSATLRTYKAPPSDLIVIHDDIDLEFGRFRLQIGGGSGGHNGVKSVIASLGHGDFARLKFGVGRPPSSVDPADYVLNKFSKAERSEVDTLIQEAVDVVELWITDPPRAQELAARFGRV